MDRSRTHRNRNERCGNYSSASEPEYDVVDDHEEVLNVRILPARPIDDEREYADRDLPRSAAAALSHSSLSTGNILPREIPITSEKPPINRDLKPNRRKTRLERRPLPPQPEEQLLHRSSQSSAPFISELVNHIAGLTPQEPFRREGQRATEQSEFSPRSKGLQYAEDDPVFHNPRRSLDLETHDIEMRSQLNLERVPSRHHHHEWPQTKEDINQHEFVPLEKPQQTHWGEDWYVGPCSRTDAEHALHLVNKDGAFLVRDCSMNSNSEPLVLAVYHDKKVYNVKIRFIESTKQYALGTGQRSNDLFDSVAGIIKFHSIFPIILISGRNVPGSRYPENCVLTCPITRGDVNQLLQ